MNRRDRAIVAGGAALLLVLVAGFGLVTRTPEAAPARPVALPTANVLAPASLPFATSAATAAPPHAERPLPRYALLVDEAADRAWCELPDDTPGRMAAASAKAASSPASAEALEMPPAPPTQQLIDGIEKLHIDWVERLRGHGDERSLALADYLEAGQDSAEVCRRMVPRARVSTDGFVHALAWTRCAATPAGRELDARQWARVDPGNQQPWLYELQRADQARDTQAMAEALHQLSLARSSVSYGPEVLRQLLGFVRAPDRGLTQTAEYGLAIGIWAAWPNPAYKPLVRSCSPPLLDANRTQTCMAIADRMWMQGGDLVTLAIAQSMARRLPYAAEELQARQRVLDELKAAAASGTDRGAAPPRESCFVTAAMRPWLDAVAEYGETEALRRKRALKR